MAIKDETGKTYGSLTVIEYAYTKGVAFWKCKCSCGNEICARGNELRNGTKTHCNNVVHRTIDITGHRYGRLVVLRFATVKNRKSYWKCICDCGNEIDVSKNSLNSGNTTSCGCVHKAIVRQQGLRNKKYCKYDLSGKCGIGYTSKGDEFWFDLDDYDKIKDYCWYKTYSGYFEAVNTPKHPLFDTVHVRLHRVILDCNKKNIQPDHILGKDSRYDNRKSNLRLATNSQNGMNKGLRSNNSSGVTGVSWHETNSKWCARIGFNNKRILLGYFENFEDAVKARKDAEVRYHKDFSYDESQRKDIS